MGKQNKKPDLLSELLAAMQNWNTPGETTLGAMTGKQFFSTAIAGLRSQNFDLNQEFQLAGQSQPFNLMRAASYYGNAEAVQVLESNGSSPRDNSSAAYFAVKGLVDSPTKLDPQTQLAYQQTFNTLAEGGANLRLVRQELERQAASMSGRGGKEERDANLSVTAFNALESGYKAHKGRDVSVTVEALPPVTAPAAAPAKPEVSHKAPLPAVVSTKEQAWEKVDAIRADIRQRLDPKYHGTLMQATAAADDSSVTAALSEVCNQLGERDRALLAEARKSLHEGGLMEPEKPVARPAKKGKSKD